MTKTDSYLNHCIQKDSFDERTDHQNDSADESYLTSLVNLENDSQCNNGREFAPPYDMDFETNELDVRTTSKSGENNSATEPKLRFSITSYSPEAERVQETYKESQEVKPFASDHSDGFMALLEASHKLEQLNEKSADVRANDSLTDLKFDAEESSQVRSPVMESGIPLQEKQTAAFPDESIAKLQSGTGITLVDERTGLTVVDDYTYLVEVPFPDVKPTFGNESLVTLPTSDDFQTQENDDTSQTGLEVESTDAKETSQSASWLYDHCYAKPSTQSVDVTSASVTQTLPKAVNPMPVKTNQKRSYNEANKIFVASNERVHLPTHQINAMLSKSRKLAPIKIAKRATSTVSKPNAGMASQLMAHPKTPSNSGTNFGPSDMTVPIAKNHVNPSQTMTSYPMVTHTVASSSGPAQTMTLATLKAVEMAGSKQTMASPSMTLTPGATVVPTQSNVLKPNALKDGAVSSSTIQKSKFVVPTQSNIPLKRTKPNPTKLPKMKQPLPPPGPSSSAQKSEFVVPTRSNIPLKRTKPNPTKIVPSKMRKVDQPPPPIPTVRVTLPSCTIERVDIVDGAKVHVRVTGLNLPEHTLAPKKPNRSVDDYVKLLANNDVKLFKVSSNRVLDQYRKMFQQNNISIERIKKN